MSDTFELLLFTDSAATAAAAGAAGIDGVVVDWECRGKYERQRGFDTQINEHTTEHLRRVRAATGIPVSCRINGWGPWTTAEVNAALDEGADEILLPMVRRPDEVARALDIVAGRCRLGILVETVDAVAAAGDLARFPLSRVYVGLNDLSIERGGNIFAPLVDGTAETLRNNFPQPFGLAGLTLPDKGSPVPCRLLIDEMARLQCSFSFLRRSFLRDVEIEQFGTATAVIRAAVTAAQQRREPAIASARAALIESVLAWT